MLNYQYQSSYSFCLSPQNVRWFARQNSALASNNASAAPPHAFRLKLKTFMRRLILLITPLLLLGFGCRTAARSPIVLTNISADGDQQLTETRSVPLSTFVTISTGDRLNINGLLVEVLNIHSLTADGCDGGPIGCPDSLELRISSIGSAQTFTLAVLNGDRQIASSERVVFGHRFLLSSVAKTNATFAVYLAEPPTIEPTPSQ